MPTPVPAQPTAPSAVPEATVPAPRAEKLTRAASLNSLASGTDYAARAAVDLAVTPLLVAGLGPAGYGVWRVLWQWTGYMWASTGRSAQALQYAIASRRLVVDGQEKRRYVGASLVVWTAFVPLLLLAGGLGIWLAPSLLDVPADEVAVVRWAAAVLVADAVLLALVTLPRSVLQGENLGYKRLGLSAALVLLGGVATAAAILAGTGLVGVAAANTVVTVMTGLVFWRVTRRHVPWFGAARPTRKELRWFAGISGWFLGWKLVLEALTASDILILGAVGSTTLVAVYVLTRYPTELVQAGVVVLVTGGIPGLAGLVGSGQTERAARVRGELLGATWLLATATGAAIMLWNESFVTLWVGADSYAGAAVTLLVVLMALQLGLLRADGFVIDTTLVLRRKVLSAALATAVAIGLAVLFVGPLDLGIVGVCLAYMAGRAVLGVYYPWLVGRALDLAPRSQLRAVVRPAATTVVLLGGATLLAARVGTDSWLVLLAAGCGTFLVALLLATGLGLTRRQRRALRSRLAGALRLRRGAR